MKTEMKFKKLQNRILLIYCLLVCLIATVLSLIFYWRSTLAIKNNAVGLVYADSRQIQLNINSYFEKMEGTAALLFSDEIYYKYDATSDRYDEYTKLQYEDAIKNKIVDLGIMENFSDFGIIYSNNYTVGWISNTTKALYKDQGMYEVATANINNDKRNDGWFFNVNEGLDRIYYVKRLNDNAVVLASIYSRELSSVFSVPSELNGTVIRLINDDNVILYSNSKEDVGTLLPEKIKNATDSNSKSVDLGQSIINVNVCENGWRVVSEVPANVIFKDLQNLKNYTFTTALVMAGFFVILGVSVFAKMSNPVDNIMVELEKKAKLDGLTGILNKKAFENSVEDELKKSIPGCSIAYVLIDVDHFKSINDMLGHAYGDQFITRTADLLKSKIPSTAILGRIGGDEFSFMLKEADKDVAEMKAYMEEIISNLSNDFNKEFIEEHKKCNVSLSIGVQVIKYHDEEFKQLYANADEALYHSKESGRNQYTFYKEGVK